MDLLSPVSGDGANPCAAAFTQREEPSAPITDPRGAGLLGRPAPSDLTGVAETPSPYWKNLKHNSILTPITQLG